MPDPSATYYTECAACSAVYEIDPEALGPRGKKVQCSVCGNQWFQKPDRLSVLKDTEGLKDYPIEEKESRMQAQVEARKDRARGRRNERDNARDRDPSRDRRNTERRDNSRRGPRAGHAQHSVFIGNLPYSCSQEKLEEMLRAKVTVTRVSLVKDATGRSKGFAFADLTSERDVETVVNELNGTQLDGRNMTVRVGRN